MQLIITMALLLPGTQVASQAPSLFAKVKVHRLLRFAGHGPFLLLATVFDSVYHGHRLGSQAAQAASQWRLVQHVPHLAAVLDANL